MRAACLLFGVDMHVVSPLLLRDSEPVYCLIRCVRGKVHTSGPLTWVHMLALCTHSESFI